jgi:hypothetical protein
VCLESLVAREQLSLSSPELYEGTPVVNGRYSYQLI